MPENSFLRSARLTLHFQRSSFKAAFIETNPPESVTRKFTGNNFQINS